MNRYYRPKNILSHNNIQQLMADQKTPKHILLHEQPLDYDKDNDEEVVLKEIFQDIEPVKAKFVNGRGELKQPYTLANVLGNAHPGGILTVNLDDERIRKWYMNQLKSNVQPAPITFYLHRKHVHIPDERIKKLKETFCAVSVRKYLPETRNVAQFIQEISTDHIPSSIVSESRAMQNAKKVFRALSKE